MKKIILATIIAAIFVSAPAQSKAETEAVYQATMLNLFIDFIELKSQGVFDEGGTFFKPGTPGELWKQDVTNFKTLIKEDGFLNICISIPQTLKWDRVCETSLEVLFSIENRKMANWVDSSIARLWLGVWCFRNPAECHLFIL